MADTVYSNVAITQTLKRYNIAECSIDYVIGSSAPIFYKDITFGDDSNFVFGYGPRANFSYPWDTLMNEIRLDPLAAYPGGASSDDPAIAALTCDYFGNLYTAGIGLSTYDIEDNTFTYLGSFPPGIQAGGALAYRDGKMYMTTTDNRLVEVDLSNPNNSTVIAQFPSEIPLIDGLVTFPYRCDSIITYAIGRDSFESFIYELDFENFSLTELCQTDLLIFGATTVEECIMPPCQLYVDLDQNDSSGGLINDFIADTICASSTLITDNDVEVFSLIDPDSVVIELNGILNQNQEYLSMPLPANLTISGNGTTRIVLINGGNASLSDFNNGLNTIVYQNDALPPAYGTREIIIQVHALYYTSEPARSFIPVYNSILQIDPITSNVNCFGGNDGSVSLLGIGGIPPYEFTWQDGTIGNTFQNLNADEYYLTITDAEGCLNVDSINITQPDSLIISILAPIDTICGNTGYLTTSVEGGTEPYFYNWNNGINEDENNMLPAATYTVTVADAENCLVEDSYTLIEETIITTNQNETLCEGESLPF